MWSGLSDFITISSLSDLNYQSHRVKESISLWFVNQFQDDCIVSFYDIIPGIFVLFVLFTVSSISLCAKSLYALYVTHFIFIMVFCV